MQLARTKRLTEDRALKILQLRFGNQIQTVNRTVKGYYINTGMKNNTIWVDGKGETSYFTREEIFQYEDEMYSQFGV